MLFILLVVGCLYLFSKLAIKIGHEGHDEGDHMRLFYNVLDYTLRALMAHGIVDQ